jgi:four helix bundle protein
MRRVNDARLRCRYAPPERRLIYATRSIWRFTRSICVADGNARNNSLKAVQSTLVAAGNISNFERSEKYIEWLQRNHISSCEATYRQKRKEFSLMTDNKNQLREDAIELAIQISDLCDEIKGCSVYVNQIVRSSSSIGANIHEAKYAQSKADFINKLEISLKECSETEYWLELIFRKGKITEITYKDLRNKCGSIRRRLIASITTAKENG